ncbi:DUF1883 domain-containing protein [Pseudonocardia sp. ICBG1142]|uniref:DUF1883 domain-containing protein n=1 Tax=Pseudonocardia sp. ICBG1142 TaxID=2846760 RepID=UPI001CF65E65
MACSTVGASCSGKVGWIGYDAVALAAEPSSETSVDYTKYDLGRLESGATVVVTLKGNAANVRLMDSSNFSSYKNGRKHKYLGGLVKRSPIRLQVPKSGHWYVTVDMAGMKGTTRSSVNVEPPPLPVARQGPMRAPLDGVAHEPPPAIYGSAKTWDVFVSHASEDKEAYSG